MNGSGISRRLAYTLFTRVPVSLLGRLTRTRLIIPYYHMISDADVAHVRHLYGYKTPREFVKDLDFLLKNYAPIGLGDLLAAMKTGGELPDRSFLLTFDDGFREMSDVVAPILEAKGVTATFFVNSAFIDNTNFCYLNKASLIAERLRSGRSPKFTAAAAEVLRESGLNAASLEAAVLSVRYQQRELLDRIADAMDIDCAEYLRTARPYLTTDQIAGLIKRGFTIGGHSIDHPLYASLSMEDQLNQTLQCMKAVRERFHLRYGAFAFPHTDRNVRREFFSRLAQSGLVDVSFGTAGLLEESVPNHLQRFSLEAPLDPAESIVAFQHARKMGKTLLNKGTVPRA